MAKKNRGFSRQLKREIKELRARNLDLLRIQDNYNALRDRAVMFKQEFSIGEEDMYQMQKMGQAPDVQLVRSMINQLMQSAEFRRMVHIEQRERNFRYEEHSPKFTVTLEVLKPIPTIYDYYAK